MDAVYIHTSCLTELGLDITPTKKKKLYLDIYSECQRIICHPKFPAI